MKKICIFILLSAAFHSINAQSSTTFGIKAGANVADISGDGVTGVDPKFSFYAGGFVNIPLSAQFSLQPEALYSGQGWKATAGNGDLNYINIPVLAQYRTPSGFYAEAGPQIGFLMSAKLKAGGASTDIKDSFKSTDFSFAGGVGYLTSINLGVNVRYTFGLSNIAEGSSTSVRNNVLQFGIFYVFGSQNRD